jgi:hypothetical protein
MGDYFYDSSDDYQKPMVQSESQINHGVSDGVSIGSPVKQVSNLSGANLLTPVLMTPFSSHVFPVFHQADGERSSVKENTENGAAPTIRKKLLASSTKKQKKNVLTSPSSEKR